MADSWGRENLGSNNPQTSRKVQMASVASRGVGALVLILTLLPPAGAIQNQAIIPDQLGVNIHFTDELPGELDMLAAGGLTLVRMDLFWDRIEQPRGQYDFSAYDRLIAALQQRRLRAIFILDYTHPGYGAKESPHDDESIAAYSRFAAEAARHFKGRDVIYEIYNEPNAEKFWRAAPDPQRYAHMAIEASRAIRAVDADAVIIAPATSGIDLPFLETCFRVGLLEHVSAVSVHPYRIGDPESVIEDYHQLRALIHRFVPARRAIPIVSGEWGYSDIWAGMDRDRQAKLLARQWLTNLAYDVAISIWYDWRDDGLEVGEPEHHFGVVEHPHRDDPTAPFTPKPAYRAAQTLSTQLGGLKFNKRLDVSDDRNFVLLFGGLERQKLAVWTTQPLPAEIKLPLSAGTFEAVFHTGERLPSLVADDQGLAIMANDSPVYLSPVQPNQALQVAAGWERLPLLTFAQSEQKVLNVDTLIRNPTTQPISVSVTGPHGKSNVSIPPDLYGKVTRQIQLSRLHPHFDVPFGFHYLQQQDFRQKMRVVMLDPVSVSLEPFSDTQIRLRVENAGGGRFIAQGAMRVATANPGAWRPIRIELNGGQQVHQTWFAVEDSLGAPFSADIVLDSAWNKEYQRQWWMRMLPSFAQHYRVEAGGDESVASHADLSQTRTDGRPPVSDAVQLDYQMDPGWKYLQIRLNNRNEPLSDVPSRLKLWVRGDASGNRLRMRFVDSAEQTFQVDGPLLDFDDWRYVEFRMNGQLGTHWGGEKTGIIKFPIRLDTLLLIDNVQQKQTSGRIRFAAPCVFYGD